MLISVRGEARRTIPPDAAVLATSVTAVRDSKLDTIRAAASGVEGLTVELARLGGKALTAETTTAPLTWSAHTVRTQIEREHLPDGSRREPTVPIIAAVAVNLTVRDLGLLDAVAAVTAHHDDVHLHRVSWHVDEDNPAWQAVRADAVAAAIRRANDYAKALGGSLASVEHLADAGLPDGTAARAPARLGASISKAFAGGDDGLDAPSLDPLAQEIVAVVEVRFVADDVSLGEA